MKENKKKSCALANYGILIKCINELFSASGGQGHLWSTVQGMWLSVSDVQERRNYR